MRITGDPSALRRLILHLPMIAAAVPLPTTPAAARELAGKYLPGEPRLALNTSATGTMTYDDAGTDRQFLRLRSGLRAEWTRWHAEVALDVHGKHAENSPGNDTATHRGISPDAPFRLRPLSTDLGHACGLDWYGELDRAVAAGPLAGGHLRIGRQAIGLGRGVLFSAVDVFAPFSALDIDREWRRGVDAARWEYRLGTTSSAEVIGVAAESWNDSAALGRVRGFVGPLDAELLAGKRAEDLLLGLDASMAVAGAEVHVDAVCFRLGDTAERHPDILPRWVGQTVVGASYTLNVGNGLTVLAEHHYNGFGETDTADAWNHVLTSGEYRKRLRRGDMKTLGTHAVACQTSYPLSMDCSVAVRWITNPHDGSGMITPFLSWHLGQRTTVLLSAFLPYGTRTGQSNIPQSEYGDTPLTLFAQVRIHD